MTTPAPALFDISKLLNQLAPREYDGKSAQDGLRFAASAQIYHVTLTAQDIDVQICWVTVLNKLTEGAAAWAGPFIIKVATGTMPWADYAAFETDFKAHFCAADDKQAATAELTKLCKTSHRLGTVKDYTTEFNAIAARTDFSDYDKRERYRTGLPFKIKDIFAQGAHDIDNVEKIQKVALSVDQALAMREEERPKQFGWKKKGEKAAATGTGRRPFKGTCFNCGEEGHRLLQCPKPRVNKPQTASSSSAGTEEINTLWAQVKAMEEKIAALMVVDKKEGF